MAKRVLWEYLRETGDYQRDENGRGPPRDISSERLDELGDGGWEFVSGCWEVWHDGTYLTEALFKRPKVGSDVGDDG